MLYDFFDNVKIDLPKGLLYDDGKISSVNENLNVNGTFTMSDLCDGNGDFCDFEEWFDLFNESLSERFGAEITSPTFLNTKYKTGFVAFSVQCEVQETVGSVLSLVGAVEVDDENVVIFFGTTDWREEDEEGNLERFSLLVKIFEGITVDETKITLNSFTPAKIIKKYIDEEDILSCANILKNKGVFSVFDKNDEMFKPFNFSSQNTEIFDNNLIIPVPEGFVAYANQGYIGQQEELIIVTDDYDNLTNYFDAPFVLTVQKVPINLSNAVPVNKQSIDAYEAVLSQVNALASDATVYRIGFRDGFIAFTQSLIDFDDPTFNKLKAIVCTDDGIYQCSFTYNHSYDAREDNVIECFVRQASRWLEAIKVVGEDFGSFPNTFAASELYSFYEQTMSMKNSAFPGAVVRTSGFAYSFVPLVKEIQNRGFSSDSKDAEEQIFGLLGNADSEYTLWQEADKMAPIFRVSKSAFDFKHDKECALKEGLAREAYMMSALRSFAWILSAYCDENCLKPEDVQLNDILEIVDCAEKRNWLSYNDSSYCNGLCGCDDINVAYTPESISPIILLGFMGEFTRTHSLEELRKDLEYIAPVIRCLYMHLLDGRDRDSALEGNEADILYMWCVLAKAAKSSFFVDNGPSMRVFTQITGGVEEYRPYLNTSKSVSNSPKNLTKEALPKANVGKKKNTSNRTVSKKLDSSIPYVTLTMDDVVVLNGILLSYAGSEKNVIFPEGITEIGDVFETSILFENIVIPEGVTRIGESAFAFQYRLKSVVLPSTLEVIGEEAFSECLLLENVIFPYGLNDIEKSAFDTCDSLKMIVIPDTVQTIGDSAFYGCGYLKHIFLSGEVDDVHEDAFFGINDNVVLHIQPDGDIEEHCKSNYLKYDYKSAEDYIPEQEKKVTEKSSLSDFVIDEAGVIKSYNGHAKIVELPDTAKEIYSFAFAHHHEIEKVIVSEGVVEIGGGAFSCCLSLKDIVLPTTLKVVGAVAFTKCISLEKISFAPGVETLGGSLFHENTKDIYLPDSITDIDNNAIYSSDNTTLHVPKGSVAEQYAKKHVIQFDNESDPMMQKYVEKVEALNRQKEEAERKAREEAERKAQEETERLDRMQAKILKQREEFIAAETEAAEKQCRETIAEISAKFEKKDNELSLKIDELKKKLIQLEQELTVASFFAFSRKRQLKNEIQIVNSSITSVEEEEKFLSSEYQIQLNDVQTKLKNQLSTLPMKAVKKFPMPSKLKK